MEQKSDSSSKSSPRKLLCFTVAMVILCETETDENGQRSLKRKAGKYGLEGIRVSMAESILDSKGRVLIPEELRKRAGLNAGSKLKLSLEGGDTVKITKSILPKQFIEELEGVIKKGSSVKREDPLKLKEIWA